MAEQVSMNYEQIKFTYKTLDPAKSADSFDFTATPETQEVGLLLPAVQAVFDEVDPKDSFDFTAEAQVQKGLLLPAVQQVREPSNLPPDEEDQAIDSFQFGSAKDDGDVSALDALVIINEIGRSAGDSRHDDWSDLLSMPDRAVESTVKPVSEGGLRSDGELVQAVSEADMGGDFIL